MKHGHITARIGGFSLVELMIALALGLVVIAGIIALFVGNSQAAAVVSGQARLQENARFAFDFISRGARQAGYFGCGPLPQNLVKGLRGKWSELPEFNVTRPVDGHEGKGGRRWIPPLSGLPGGEGGNLNRDPAGGIDPRAIVDETDVLILRHLRQPAQRLARLLEPTADPVVAAPRGDAGFDVGDIVMVADCEQGAVFRVTALSVSGTRITVERAPGPGLFDNAEMVPGPEGLIPATLSLIDRPYGPEASISAVDTTFFFIAPSLHVDDRGANPLALWQKVGSAAPVELIQGVQDLQVLYGVDTTLTDGIANPNQYVPFDAVPEDVGQIVAIRATLTVNSVDPVTDDGARLVRTFSKTILVRNANPEA